MSLFCGIMMSTGCVSVGRQSAGTESASIKYVGNPSEPTDFAQDTLVRISPHPENGFHFAYYLYVPEGLQNQTRTVLYVEPNNTGTVNDDLNVHDQAARKLIESSYSHRIAKRLKSPMLVPVFPRPASRWQEYTHYLNRQTMMIPEGPLKRIDLQLCAMIEDARVRLSRRGVVIAQKVFINGFSSSAGFALRFTALHPGLVQATSAGGINALPILPLKEWMGKELPYPVGVADMKKIAGVEFDSKTFLQIPQKLYMGVLDTNDTVPFRDAWDQDEAEFIRHTLGERMMPDRWDKIQKLYRATGANVNFMTYPSVGHKVTPEIEEDIFQFFSIHR